MVGELGPAHVEDALIRHARGFSVLLAPAEPAPEVPAGLYRAAVALLAGSFDVVVLHLPRSFQEPTLTGVSMADELALVVAPELFAVYSARRAVSALGLGPDRPYRIVVNPVVRGGIGGGTVARVLGQRPTAGVRFDPAVRRAQERGQLLKPGNRRAARDVSRLAAAPLEDVPGEGRERRRGPRR